MQLIAGLVKDFQVKRMVARGQLRLRRTIRNLENSVEFSPNENKARANRRKSATINE